MTTTDMLADEAKANALLYAYFEHPLPKDERYPLWAHKAIRRLREAGWDVVRVEQEGRDE